MVSENSSERYIISLFKTILGRKTIGEEELAYWRNELDNGRDHSEILELFWTSEENQKRLGESADVSPYYPHGHFYSPIVSLDEVRQFDKSIFLKNRDPNVFIDAEKMKLTIKSILSEYRKIPFSDEKSPGLRYYYNNTSFGFGDACVYWGMISFFKPNKVIEIGSGFTSALLLDAIDQLQLRTECTFIDPYPDLLREVASPIDDRHNVISKKVQSLDGSIVESLEINDILFIDSSHVVKTGSDVLFEIMNLLPRLRKGVIVHFHDIFYPFEYPREWILNERHSWNEIYFVQAFLMYNNKFEVLYFNDYAAKMLSKEIQMYSDVSTSERIEMNPGGGLWLRTI